MARTKKTARKTARTGAGAGKNRSAAGKTKKARRRPAKQEVRPPAIRCLHRECPGPGGVGGARRARGAGSYAHLRPAHTVRTRAPAPEPNAPTPPNFTCF